MSSPYSVLIRTYNSEKTIGKCLDGILAQLLKPNKILLVDSGSTDHTEEIAKTYDIEWDVIPRSQEFNYSASLNQGFALLSSPLVFVISSHTVLKNENCAEIMINSIIGDDRLIACYCVANQCEQKDRDAMPRRIDLQSYNGWNGLWNTCALIRRAKWIERPFNESLWAAEDQEWAYWWFQNNNELGVLRFENLDVYNMNPKKYSTWKRCSDFVSISIYSLPCVYDTPRCVKEVIKSLADRFVRKAALVDNVSFLFPFCLLAYRLRLLSFGSNYHKGPPWWMRKLITD
jgi:glycosyltransferase involved in cell wall biosynthesis